MDPLKSSEPKTVRLPPEILPLIEARMEALGYRSFSDYMLGLTLYDCWVERPHEITAPIFAKPKKARDKMVLKIIDEFETKKKTGRAAEDSYFETRVREIAARIAEEKRLQEEKGKPPQDPPA